LLQLLIFVVQFLTNLSVVMEDVCPMIPRITVVSFTSFYF